MKKIFFLSLLLCFSSLVFGQKKGKPKAKPVKSDWTLVSNPYEKTKSIQTGMYQRDGNKAYRLKIEKSNEGKYYYVTLDWYEDVISYSQKNASSFDVYIMINGELKNFWVMNALFASAGIKEIRSEILEALKIGTMGSIKFYGDPNYYEFSLTGFNKSLLLLD